MFFQNYFLSALFYKALFGLQIRRQISSPENSIINELHQALSVIFEMLASEMSKTMKEIQSMACCLTITGCVLKRIVLYIVVRVFWGLRNRRLCFENKIFLYSPDHPTT